MLNEEICEIGICHGQRKSVTCLLVVRATWYTSVNDESEIEVQTATKQTFALLVPLTIQSQTFEPTLLFHRSRHAPESCLVLLELLLHRSKTDFRAAGCGKVSCASAKSSSILYRYPMRCVLVMQRHSKQKSEVG